MMDQLSQNVFARIEKKYLITELQAQQIAKELRDRGFHMLDFGSPAIQSLYYDTPDYLLIRRSLDRPVYKEKLRLRAYGHPDEQSLSFIEIKKKYKGVVYKRRVSMSLADASEALRQGRIPESAGQIGREIQYMLDLYGLMPAALIRYDRDAYASDTEPGVRVTIDRNIRFRHERMDLTQPQSGEDLLEPGQALLEIKIPGAYPLWLLRILDRVGARPAHFSKYGTAYQRLIVPELRQSKTREALFIA